MQLHPKHSKFNPSRCPSDSLEFGCVTAGILGLPTAGLIWETRRSRSWNRQVWLPRHRLKSNLRTNVHLLRQPTLAWHARGDPIPRPDLGEKLRIERRDRPHAGVVGGNGSPQRGLVCSKPALLSSLVGAVDSQATSWTSQMIALSRLSRCPGLSRLPALVPAAPDVAWFRPICRKLR